ncbi:hypothetical protein BJ165DRAFT_1608768 [Panaeolus papilionaceus]|nr:hypothetical protein BJ165DRAFT_1608768 [Panaeolus papilionaceus]
MLAREAFTSILLFLFAFQISGAFARPSFTLTSRRYRSGSAAAARSDVRLEYTTNAERMAAGLQPRAPTRVFDPRHFNNQPKPSAVPYSGSIQVKKRNGDVLGWVASSLVSGGRFTVTGNSNQKVGVSFSYLNSNTELQLKISDSASYPYIGGNGDILVPYTNGKAAIVRTDQVGNSLSLPKSVGNSAGSGATQSFIWNFDPTSKEITATWLNLWGQTSVNIFYRNNDPGKGLYISADDDLGDKYTRVRFYLV